MRGGLLSTSRRRGLKTISYIGAGGVASAITGANITLSYPASIQADDFLWVPCTASVSTAFASNALSGFSRRVSTNSNATAPVIAGFWKRATGSESGTITLTSPGGSSIANMYLYRGVNVLNPFPVADATFGVSTSVTAYDIPDQTPGVAGCVGLVAADGNNTAGSWTPPTNYTELLDSGNANAQIFFNGHRLALVATATGVRTATRSGSVKGCAFGVIIQPAAA